MSSKKPNGSYHRQLVDEIRQYHAQFLSIGNKRNSKNTPPDSSRITREMLAACATINKSTWSKIFNGKAYLPKEELFRIIAMPWVAHEAAQRWILLWMANELDAYTFQIPDEEIYFLEAMKSPKWSPTRNLDRLSDSLALMSNYVPTLGVIDQIDHARRRHNDSVPDPDWHLQAMGPTIAREDFERVPTDNLAQMVQNFRRNQPLTKLAMKFAQDLASHEYEEHSEHLVGLLRDEEEEANDAKANRCPDEARSSAVVEEETNLEQLREEVIAHLGLDVEDRLYAAAAADIIIGFAKGLPGEA